MSRGGLRGSLLRSIGLGLIALLASVAQAQSDAAVDAAEAVAVETSFSVLHTRLPASESAIDAQRQLDRFVPVEPDQLRALPAPGLRDWFWVRPSAAGERALALDLPRAALRRVEAWRSGAEPELIASDGLFQPTPGDWLQSRFRLPVLGAGDGVLLSVDAVVGQALPLQLLDEREQLRAERASALLAVASYAALLATVLTSLALTLAVRESVFRFFTVFAALHALFLAAAAGHLFELPLLSLLGLAELRAVLLLGLASVAAALAFSSRLLGLASHSPPLQRWTDRCAGALLLLGVLGLVVPAALQPAWVQLGSLLMLLAALLPVGVAVWNWSLGSRVAGVLGLLWLGFLITLAARLGVLGGWFADSLGTQWVYQFGGALSVVFVSIALTDRVIMIRRAAEQIQQLHAESSASLQVEQQRRRFQQSLKDAAGSAVAAGDLEWRAFRLLLQTVGELISSRSVGLSVTGYRGYDYLLSEPMNSKARLCGLLAERAATLKGICRSRTAMQVPFDVADGGREPYRGQFAVIPLAVPRPGWGALILERESGLEFPSAELAIASEFAELTLQAIEEHAIKADLRRSAEIDPLTGLTNRRAGEARLETLLLAAQTEKQPISLLFIDFDHFRPINERHGVGVGDQCLRGVADALRPLLGSADLLIRYGGDEFVLALPGQGLEPAREMAERVRAEVASLRFRSDHGPVKVTVSIGVAEAALASDTVGRLIDRAERASGSAKGSGRNQVQVTAAFGAQGSSPSERLHF